MRRIEVIVIGTSAGGVSALQEIFSRLQKTQGPPIIVIQHMPPDAHISLDLVFSRRGSRHISEAGDKTPLLENEIVFAPPGYHTLVERDRTLSLTQDEQVLHARPSIDVTFESVAEVYGRLACGVLMTGASEDGARGLKAIADAGGLTFVQDPEEAEAPYMPNSALQIMTPSAILTLAKIAERLEHLARGEDS